jgi:dihydroflavonol-4-reductase
MQRLIITGATGHIGNNLIKSIDLNKYEVIAIVLKNDPFINILPKNIKILYGDICDEKFVNSTIKKDDIIIHLAGIIDITKERKDLLYKVNVEGTKTIANACLANNAKLIYVSTVHVLTPTKDKPIDETNILNTNVDFSEYERTKCIATKYIFDLEKKGLKASVIYPSGIIGKNDYRKSELGTLLIKIKKNKLPFCIRGGYSFVDVMDVCKAIIKIIDDNIWCDSFIISGEYISIIDLIKVTQELTNRKKKIIPLPKFMAYASIPFFMMSSKIKKEKPLFTACSLKTLETNSKFNTNKMKTILGIEPKPIKQSIQETLDFFKENKMD